MAKRLKNEIWNLERRAARAVASRDKYQADKLRLITLLRDASRSRDNWKQKYLELNKLLATATSVSPSTTGPQHRR